MMSQCELGASRIFNPVGISHKSLRHNRSPRVAFHDVNSRWGYIFQQKIANRYYNMDLDSLNKRAIIVPHGWKGTGRSDLGDFEEPIERLGKAANEVGRFLNKYAGGSSSQDINRLQFSSPIPKNGDRKRKAGMGNGVFALLLINFALHILNYFYHPQWLSMLALNHWAPHWWQFITAAFVHANWEHLLSNAFSLLVFGRMVEEEEGAFGIWFTYLVCGLGGNIASYLTAPAMRAISLGASSAVFGLFVVGVAAKLRPSLKSLLEATILGSFVVKQVWNEVSLVAGGKSVMMAGISVGHWAHLGGAMAGVLLLLLISKLPEK